MEDLSLLIREISKTEPYVTVETAADHFDTSKWTLYRLAETNRVPSYKIGGKRRFKISELELAFKT